MKRIIALLLIAASMMLGLAPAAGAQGYSRTPADIYLESYAGQMKKMMPDMLHDERARQYRERYEVCDQHHNCRRGTGADAEELEVAREKVQWPFLVNRALMV